MKTARDNGKGRPRAFDEARFLDGAIALFSASGFSGVSISDLTEATGLTTGSVYKAYKDKEGVFERALEQYIAHREAQTAEILAAAQSGRCKIEAIFNLYVDLSLGKEGQLGCMVVAGLSDLHSTGRVADTLRRQLSHRRSMLAKLVAEGQKDGSVMSRTSAEITADILLVLLQGMRVVAKIGLLTKDRGIFLADTLKILN